VTPVNHGAPGGGATLREVRLGRCWNVQGFPQDAAFAAEIETRFGLSLPPAPNTSSRGKDWTALWLGPKSWLLIAHDVAPHVSSDSPSACIDALNACGGALFEVSAGRVAFAVSGVRSDAILARGCPVDLHDSAFPRGTCAQTLLGQMGVLLFRPEVGTTFLVFVAPSLGRDCWRTLCGCSECEGYEVGAPIAFGAVVRPPGR
jgi:sarcosine oxidase, subunit gamma